ncbi:MAG: flavodoxin family protein [Clostridiales bacterium]|nr:flavodoxin family protein [Clostridiales bacterium]
MKTLILNGSPSKNGDTMALINEFMKHLNGDIRILSHYDYISPCVDCRYCWSNPGCCTNDEKLKGIYSYLHYCDNIVLASPIWFSSLSGPLLNLASIVQALWANSNFLKLPNVSKLKNGVIIITGAQEGTEVIPTQTAFTIMKYMNVDILGVAKVYSLNTNILPAKEDSAALEKCREAAKRLICMSEGKDNGTPIY